MLNASTAVFAKEPRAVGKPATEEEVNGIRKVGIMIPELIQSRGRPAELPGTWKFRVVGRREKEAINAV